MITTTLSVREETFNKFKGGKNIHIQSKSKYTLNQEMYISNRGVTSDVIVGKVIKKGRIKSNLHGRMFLYTIKRK